MPAILSGGFPCQQPPKGAERGLLFMGMTPTRKTVSSVSLGFPGYGMSNANTLGGPSPSQQPPKCETREHLFMGMTPRLNKCQTFF